MLILSFSLLFLYIHYINQWSITPSTEFTFTEPRIHAFVYEPGTGIAQRLDVNFKEYLDDLRNVYELYKVK